MRKRENGRWLPSREAPDAIISHEPFMDEVLRDFVCKDGTTYEMCPPCVQMSYTRKELLQAPKSDIRLLTEDYAEIIDENYDLLSIDGIREHLREGKLFGIFEGEVLAGFAGEHSARQHGHAVCISEIPWEGLCHGAGAFSHKRNRKKRRYAVLPDFL